jgi:hypothetical protein
MQDKAMDTDFNAMSEEELATFINSANDEEPVINEEVVEEPEQAEEDSETVEETEEEVVSEESEDDKPEEAVESDDDLPFYKGKSREDIIDMQENAKRKISRQENELNSLRKEIESIKNSLSDKKEQANAEELDEFLNQYDTEDRKAIEVIIDKKLRDIETAKVRQTEEQQQTTVQENERFWSDAKDFIDPQTYNQVQESLIKEMQNKGKESTLYKPNWVKDFVRNQIQSLKNDSEAKATSKTNLIKKKAKAATVTGGSANTGNNWKGKPEPEDPEEYRHWAKANLGVVI